MDFTPFDTPKGRREAGRGRTAGRGTPTPKGKTAIRVFTYYLPIFTQTLFPIETPINFHHNVFLPQNNLFFFSVWGYICVIFSHNFF